MNHSLVFHVGRSGSTVLGDMLNQHSLVHWDNEIYEPVLAAWAESGELQRRGNAAEALAFLKARMAKSPKALYGFEVKFFHLQRFNAPLAMYLEGAEKLGVRRFIVLRRRNTLRKVVSSLVAHQKNQFHIPADRQAAPTAITIDVNSVAIDRDRKPLIAFLEDYESCFGQLRTLLSARAHLELVYEDHILTDPSVAYRRTCAFLEINPENPRVRFGRTTPFALRDVVTNLGEVRQALSGTPFEGMVEDELER